MPWFKAWAGNVLSEWYQRLIYLFVAIIMWQWLNCLEGYWWEETFSVVHGVLIATVVTELLLPGSRLYRFIVQLLLLVWMTIRYTGYIYVDKMEGSWREASLWQDWFIANLDQLQPFLWIGLGIWALLQSSCLWTTTRLRVMTLITFFLATLLIVDSFSPIVLWDNVAWTVFVGLAWLVAEHFSRFQTKHPDSWKHLLEYPAALFFPTVIILALVMVSGIFAPNLAPVFKDPYTSWREARGETVPSFVGDKGVSSGSSTPANPRSSSSGYSRQDETLGGGFEFDYSTVMLVNSSHRSYWRGESKAMYTGDGWVDGPLERREASVIGLINGEPLPLEEGPDEGIETVEVTQVVTMVREEPLPVLFGAAAIEKLVSLKLGEDELPLPGRLAWLPESWELRWPQQNSQVPYPSEYTVISQVPVLDEGKLMAAGTEFEDEQKKRVYLQLSEDLPERVRTLTEQIIADAELETDAPYAKMKALESYLKLTFPYTNAPDTSKRSSSDFVDAFLFEVQEGYCDYFSSALAVMGRIVGVPTRWVKGYAPGILPMDSYLDSLPIDLEFFDYGAGTYTVRNADAHSWVEAYFEGVGWIPFEPTSGFSFPYTYAEAETALPTDDLLPAEEAARVEQTATTKLPTIYFMLIVGAALIIAAIVRRKQLTASFIRWRYRTYSANQRIVLEIEKLLRFGRRKGLMYSEQETVRETIHRWGSQRASLRQEFDEILRAFERAKYSRDVATADDAEALLTKVKLLKERL